MHSICSGICAIIAATSVAIGPAHARTALAPLTGKLETVIAMPITRNATAKDARGLPARINFMVQQPGSEGFFITDQSGTLYLFDKKTRALSAYLRFDGSSGHSGIFQRFIADGGLASGLLGVTFDPDFSRNGKFYSLHLEDTASTASQQLKVDASPGLDPSGYRPTLAIVTPSGPAAITRHAVLVEWTDTQPLDNAFNGKAREVMRVELPNGIHPMNDLTFNPSAKPGDRDWRALYIAVGDSAAGETDDVRRFNPQRLDTLGGKILRIIPDIEQRHPSSELSENGQYRVPRDNPFSRTAGARKEIFALGMRNPHRMAWRNSGTGRADLLAFVVGSNIGLPRYETIDLVRAGDNFGYPLREGPENKPANPIVGSMPSDGRLPLRINEATVLNKRHPAKDSALAYRTTVEGNAIAGGFVYSGKKWPNLQGMVVFGDIMSGRIFYARMSDLEAATDGKPTTLAPYAEIHTDLAKEVHAAMVTRAPGPPPRRIDLRLATDADGEIYVLTKSDGVVRRIESLQ